MTLNEKVRALFVTYKGVFQGAMAAFVGRWDKIATKVTSTSSVNVYGWLGQSASFRNWVGPRTINAIATFGYTIPNVTKEVTVEIKREDVEDDNVGIYMPLVTDLGQEAVRDIDELVYGALKVNGLCFDGKTYFAADHPREFTLAGVPEADSPVFSNLVVADGGADAQGPAWYALCTARAIKPVIYQERKAAQFVSKTDLASENVFNNNTFVFGADKRDAVGYTLPQFAIKCTAPLDGETFEKVRAQLESMTGDAGKPLGLTLDTVVVPPGLRADGQRVLEAMNGAAGASNIHYKAAELIVTPYVQ
jgi:phage major head subunit gpT-like protein